MAQNIFGTGGQADPMAALGLALKDPVKMDEITTKAAMDGPPPPLPNQQPLIPGVAPQSSLPPVPAPNSLGGALQPTGQKPTTPEEVARNKTGWMKFVEALADPTGGAGFLFNTGAQLLQPKPVEQSTAGFVTGTLADSLQRLRKTKEAEKGADLTTRKMEADIAATTSATDRAQKKLPYEISALEAAAIAKKAGGKKLPAAQVQLLNVLARAKMQKNPELSLADAQLDSYKMLQPAGKDPNLWYADAMKDFWSLAAPYMDETEQQAAVGQLQETYKNLVLAQKAPQPKPAVTPPPAAAELPKTYEEAVNYFSDKYKTASPAQIAAQVRLLGFTSEKAPETVKTKKPEKAKATPKISDKADLRTLEAVRKILTRANKQGTMNPGIARAQLRRLKKIKDVGGQNYKLRQLITKLETVVNKGK